MGGASKMGGALVISTTSTVAGKQASIITWLGWVG